MRLQVLDIAQIVLVLLAHWEHLVLSIEGQALEDARAATRRIQAVLLFGGNVRFQNLADLGHFCTDRRLVIVTIFGRLILDAKHLILL